ncbi:uncharacterized protein LOC119612231 [Lucilia sericata]|uniref:uncharacterized protein LOC119612231 n=1 Tax=Lucilia sericata TaxID=13632 RepID=UPI0018A8452B|nr:uncharacterized protein LOC119612231 [Lucilia sericata]
MRYYPCATPYIYSEFPNNWNLYCQKPNISWQRKPQQAKHSINIWRDLEAAKIEKILHKDLYIKNWSKTRLRTGAFLPLYYGTGIERPHFQANAKKLTKVENDENLKNLNTNLKDKFLAQRAAQQGKLKRN